MAWPLMACRTTARTSKARTWNYTLKQQLEGIGRFMCALIELLDLCAQTVCVAAAAREALRWHGIMTWAMAESSQRCGHSRRRS